MREVRELECYLHNDTLQSLIAVHLQAMKVVRSSEDVVNLSLSAPNKDGVHTLRFNLEPVVQIIQHN